MFGRTRKPNYSHEENIALLDQLELHKEVLFPKGQIVGSRSRQRYALQIWSSILEVVNALPNGANRTVEELRHRWKDMSHKVRTAIRKQQIYGEPVCKPYPLYFHKIISILGEELDTDAFVSDHLSIRSAPSSSSKTSPSPSNSFLDVKPDLTLLNNPQRQQLSPPLLLKQDISEEGVANSRKTPHFLGNECDGSDESDATVDNLSAPLLESSFHSEQSPLNLAISKPSASDATVIHSSEQPRRPTPSRKSSQARKRQSKGLMSRSTVNVKRMRMNSMVLDPQTEMVLQYNPLPGDRGIQEAMVDQEDSSTEADFHGEHPAPPTPDAPSVEELKRKYYAEKIALVQQKAAFVRLQETKLQIEIQLLQKQLATPSPLDPNPLNSLSVRPNAILKDACTPSGRVSNTSCDNQGPIAIGNACVNDSRGNTTHCVSNTMTSDGSNTTIESTGLHKATTSSASNIKTKTRSINNTEDEARVNNPTTNSDTDVNARNLTKFHSSSKTLGADASKTITERLIPCDDGNDQTGKSSSRTRSRPTRDASSKDGNAASGFSVSASEKDTSDGLCCGPESAASLLKKVAAKFDSGGDSDVVPMLSSKKDCLKNKANTADGGKKDFLEEQPAATDAGNKKNGVADGVKIKSKEQEVEGDK